MESNKDKWYSLNEKMEEFMYGDTGILTVAFFDENLKTYKFDIDKVIEIIKELKELEKLGLTESQKKQLSILKDRFLEIKNDQNNINNIYNQIKNIYNNIEEF